MKSRVPVTVPSKPERVLQTSATFFRETPSTVATSNGETEVLELFHRVREQVPAYAKFLTAHGAQMHELETIEDFRTLPLTSKRNYHTQYPLAELCRFGRLEDCDMLAVSSGSTGEPTVWPRFITDEVATLRRFEQVLTNGFGANTKRTLAVVCFALGSWVGGMYTTSACRQIAAKGAPITVVTPGNNFAEILRVIPKLAPHFEQVVLFGYPPFLKDVIERGLSVGIRWSEYDVKLVMAGEVFSESWRDLVAQRLGQAAPAYCTASLYGTADGGVLANETPASILVRQALTARPELARELFGQSRVPTLCQYDPRDRYFELVDGDLVFSADGGIPLIRYNILDNGGLVTHAAMRDYLLKNGALDDQLRTELDRFAMPFVYVFGRNNFAVSHYGANVYPENIAIGLEQPAVERAVTGKFVLEVRENEAHDSILQITVELASGQSPSEPLRTAIGESMLTHLRRVNSEFANYVPKGRQALHVELRPLGDTEYFPVGVKHRYTR